MTIKKGEAWGSSSGPPIEATLDDDASLAAHVGDKREAVVSARGGDLVQTLGLSDGPRREPRWFPIDMGFVRLDGGPEHPFVAHVIARRPAWLGQAAVVMNAAWQGNRYLGPRSHPNDGLLDITVGALPPRQLLAAAKRAKTGVHLPHPALVVRRVRTWEHTFDRPRTVWIDGRPMGHARALDCRVENDWFTLVG